MEYLEAIAIKRLRPDGLPAALAHLPAEADRVIKRHHAMRLSGDSDVLLIPILSIEQRARMNKVLIANLAFACGLLAAWRPARTVATPVLPIEVSKEDPQRAGPLPANPGPSAGLLDRWV